MTCRPSDISSQGEAAEVSNNLSVELVPEKSEFGRVRMMPTITTVTNDNLRKQLFYLPLNPINRYEVVN